MTPVPLLWWYGDVGRVIILPPGRVVSVGGRYGSDRDDSGRPLVTACKTSRAALHLPAASAAVVPDGAGGGRTGKRHLCILLLA
jgi:hypothetical protein